MASGVLTDDGSVWPEDQPAQTPPQNPPSDPYGGYWIPRILGNLFNTAKSGINATGDVMYGDLHPGSPEFVQRMGDMATTATMLPGLFAGEPGALNAGMRRSTVAAPAVAKAVLPTSDDVARITARTSDLRKGAWPQTDTSAMFTPEDRAATSSLVPQRSVQLEMPAPSETFPLKTNRTAPITANAPAISAAIAERLYPWVRDQDPRLGFYDAGGIHGALTRMGIDPATIMPEWAGQVAATSPLTSTPPNLRHASYLLYRMGQNNPFLKEEFMRTGNPEGMGFMGSQLTNARKFAEGAQNAGEAPKTFTFDQNVQGNLASPTIDTHNIQGTLYQFDQLHPGQVPPEWFSDAAAYERYRANGGFTPNRTIVQGDINDSLPTVQRGGVKKQVEYGPMTTPWYGAAEQLGISPAQAQAGGWFNYGGVTGLRSPVRSMSQLFGDQVYDTARTLGISPERVLDWWSKKLIPLTQNEAGPPQTMTG